MQGREAFTKIRDEARAFEEALPPSQRKNLGQFFTGLPLGRILAHLAVDNETRCILDPMAGSGDLLDAVGELAASAGTNFDRIDAIEIDGPTAAVCEARLGNIYSGNDADVNVMHGDAFDPQTHKPLPATGYDLVITNPPYVRYQSLNGRADNIRQGLLEIAGEYLSGNVRDIWRALAGGYSGLADLSVPAWLLSALLVRPGGRLALVVPATWRSRAYADVIRYLLLRCFRLELIVEDTQPRWFSDALVRTHLVLARRLPDNEIAIPLSARSSWPDARWIQVAPEASSAGSLAGNAFVGKNPEIAFAAWCFTSKPAKARGITARSFPLEGEWQALCAQASTRPWMRALERVEPGLPLFADVGCPKAFVPNALRDVLPVSFNPQALRTLEDSGICAGQGLRTGCNRFFYVRLAEALGAVARIVTDPAIGGHTLTVPTDALHPVLHRQADLMAWRAGKLPATRVLDLRRFVLPEDEERMVAAAKKQAADLPALMPYNLAAHVRIAGETLLGSGAHAKPISGLSAVKTNVRPARAGALPRFWYMLPDFAPRHLPQGFVPRIIHDAPFVEGNTKPPILIDANFSTFWTDNDTWRTAGLVAFLNSAWCRAVMEAAGTPLGGGALKLEAVHLRRMPVPRLSAQDISTLNTVGQDLREIDRIVLRGMLAGDPSHSDIDAFAQHLNERRACMAAARLRGAA